MGSWALARLRTLVTLAALVLIMVLGVSWAWAKVTAPFPGNADADATPICVDATVQSGDKVRPGAVTISVLNAGSREGLANQTLEQFVGAGFGAGELDNAPRDADVKRVQIWATDPDDPAVRLVRSYVGQQTKVVKRDAGEPGVSVVVGDRFDTLKKGEKAITATHSTTICGPPLPA